MPGGQTKFAGAWLLHVDTNGQKLSEWCNKGKDDYHGYCQFCNTDIRIDNAGKAQFTTVHTKKETSGSNETLQRHNTNQIVLSHKSSRTKH